MTEQDAWSEFVAHAWQQEGSWGTDERCGWRSPGFADLRCGWPRAEHGPGVVHEQDAARAAVERLRTLADMFHREHLGLRAPRAECAWRACRENTAVLESYDAAAPLPSVPSCGMSSHLPAAEARYVEARREIGAAVEGGCGRPFNWLNFYRCLECGRWLCRPCIEAHFKEPSAAADPIPPPLASYPVTVRVTEVSQGEPRVFPEEATDERT